MIYDVSRWNEPEFNGREILIEIEASLEEAKTIAKFLSGLAARKGTTRYCLKDIGRKVSRLIVARDDQR
jgi:hypothetical protein